MAKGKGPVGSITIICGSMFSGKTEELIRLVRRAMHARKRVQVFKSSVDTRSETTVIRTHDDTRFHAIAVPDARALESLLEADTQVVGIEEIQFFDEAVVGLCQRLADRGIEVIAAGLDQDFRGQPFGFMPVLMALADNVRKLHAICKVCGQEASRTQRLVDGRPAAWDEPTILVGADERYEARCRRCHRVRKAPKGHRIASRSGAESGSAAGEARKTAQGPTVKFRAGKNGARANGNGNHKVTTTPNVPDDGTQLEMFPEMEEDAGA